MERRDFLKHNTALLAGLPLFSFPGVPNSTASASHPENPDFPFTKDFPEASSQFVLRVEPLRPVGILTSRSVEHEAALVSGEGSARFRGNRIPAMVVLDMGRQVVGQYSFAVRATATARLTITYGEGVEEVINGFKGINWYQHPTDVYAIKAGKNTCTLKGRRAFRYLRIDTEDELEVYGFKMSHQHYPVQELGRFYCSDPELNRMWQVGAYTTKLCMQQFYEDGIKRDGLLWVSDLRIQFLCNAYAFADAPLARKSLFMVAASQRKDGAIPACAAYGGGHQHPENINYMGKIPFSYGAHWILINYSSDFFSCLNDYVVYTADRSIIGPMLPTLGRLMAFLEGTDFRPNPNMPMGRDRLTDDAGVPAGQNGILQGAFLFQVYTNLKDGQMLLQETDPALAGRCKALAQKVEALIEAEHYDPARKIYTDFPGNTGQVSWHTNAFAVLAGKAKQDDRLALLKRTEALATVEPAIGAMKQFQVEAMLEAGWEEKAIGEMKRYWGRQIREGATTFWEYFKPHDAPANVWESALMSRCHGWSAGPTYLLPRFFLGVRPSDSWASATIQPLTTVLEWAEGTVPTPFGEIEVAWQKDKKAYISLPEGITATWKAGKTTRTLTPGQTYELSL